MHKSLKEDWRPQNTLPCLYLQDPPIANAFVNPPTLGLYNIILRCFTINTLSPPYAEMFHEISNLLFVVEIQNLRFGTRLVLKLHDVYGWDRNDTKEPGFMSEVLSDGKTRED
jgi:hypothetical protein